MTDGKRGRGSQGGLPRDVREEVTRLTPKNRLQPTLELLEIAGGQFADGRFRPALQKLRQAKDLSPRAPIIRELMGLSSYRLGHWRDALRELRTYRRLTGDTTHLPVEMDCLRALDRDDEVESAWRDLQDHGARPAAMKEGRVVYGAFLLDRGEARRAWEVTRPGRISTAARDEDLRQWYVAARAAAALGDTATARQLLEGIEGIDDTFPALQELEVEIAAAEQDR